MSLQNMISKAEMEFEQKAKQKRENYKNNVIDYLRSKIVKEKISSKVLEAIAKGQKSFILCDLPENKFTFFGKTVWKNIDLSLFQQLLDDVIFEKKMEDNEIECLQFSVERVCDYTYTTGFFYPREVSVYKIALVVSHVKPVERRRHRGSF